MGTGRRRGKAQVGPMGRAPEGVMTQVQSPRDRLEWPDWAELDVVLLAAKVTVWGRWFIWISAVGFLLYRPSLWYPEDMEFLFLNATLAVVNGILHYRILRKRPVTWRWMLAISAADIVLITSNIALLGTFDNYVFVIYYPALAAFAMVFTIFWLSIAWTTATAIAYTVVSAAVGSGLDLTTGDERDLFARVATMYLIVVGISLIIRFERTGRQAALAGERQLQQERIELAQAIHDTSAQSAYMIGLGIDGAIKLAGDANPKLSERLAATSALAKSAMWELRKPIDMGSIFEGRELGRVLGSHTATFAAITSVPAGMVQSGHEPPLSMAVRTGLFSIAHNALTNAFLHAQAGSVEVRLDFEAGGIRLMVSDDGVGLPDDYADRGRGFSGMQTDAERMGGKLVVDSDGGTTIMCMVPYQNRWRGERNVISQRD